MDPQRLQTLAGCLDAAVQQGQLPGGVVSIARRGIPVLEHAFGVLDPQDGRPMRTDALFRIYSMTKPLTSVAALVLVEQGRLQLADPVERHLPELAQLQVATASGTEAAHRPITVHHLLTHTAGFCYGARTSDNPTRRQYAERGVDVNPRDLAPAEFLRRLAQVPLLHQPGEVWEYSHCTDVLGVLLERITGQRLGELLRRLLFEPLGMQSTAFVVSGTDAQRLAEPFTHDPATGLPIERPAQSFDARQPPAMDSGGAGGISCAADYMRFARMLLAGGVLDGRRILGRKTVEWMCADHLGRDIRARPSPGEAAFASPGFGFGLGLGVRLADGLANVPGSAGACFWSGTAGTMFWIDPREELQVVFLTQAPGALRQHFRRLITTLAFQALCD
jgi:CubicO group peptidase (beta-lactamase class C family)